MRHAKPQAAKRRAFTLIEMLVVITIILMLAAMLVMLSPGVSTRQQAARGATQFQTALMYAKNRAKMNLLPTGVLVSPSPWATNIQYIQSGGDYAQGGVTSVTPPAGGFQSVTISNGGANLTTVANVPGNPPDFFEIAGSGLAHQIASVGPNTLTILAPVPSSAIPAFNLPQPPGVSYRIMRSPRQLYGEQPVELPQDVAVDLTYSAAFQGNASGAAPTSVLFAPSGALTGAATGYDLICYTVRDTTLTWPQGFPTIIAVYGKTGFITAHPVNVNPALFVGQPQYYPYYFAMNARSSGL